MFKLPQQYNFSIDLNTKMTTYPKGEKDWALVLLSVENQHNYHKPLSQGHHFIFQRKHEELYLVLSYFLLLGRWSFCYSSQHFKGSEVVMLSNSQKTLQ